MFGDFGLLFFCCFNFDSIKAQFFAPDFPADVFSAAFVVVAFEAFVVVFEAFEVVDGEEVVCGFVVVDGRVVAAFDGAEPELPDAFSASAEA